MSPMARLLASSHELAPLGNLWQFAKSLQARSQHAADFRAWLASACEGHIAVAVAALSSRVQSVSAPAVLYLPTGPYSLDV
jgi:hypothetical protein